MTTKQEVLERLNEIIEDTGMDATAEQVFQRFQNAYRHGVDISGSKAEGRARAFGSLHDDFRRDDDKLAEAMLALTEG